MTFCQKTAESTYAEWQGLYLRCKGEYWENAAEYYLKNLTFASIRDSMILG